MTKRLTITQEDLKTAIHNFEFNMGFDGDWIAKTIWIEINKLVNEREVEEEAEISLLEEIIKSMEISLCIERETIRKIRVAWLKYHDSGPIEALKCIKEIHALLELKEEEE